MEINHLIHILKHGYQYTHTKEDGSSENVLVAPNKHMIKAAAAIEALHNNLQQVIGINKDLVRQLETIFKEQENAKTPVQDSSPVSADGNVSPTTDSSSG